MIKLWAVHEPDGQVLALFQMYYEASNFTASQRGSDELTIKRVDLSELIPGSDVCYVKVDK